MRLNLNANVERKRNPARNDEISRVASSFIIIFYYYKLTNYLFIGGTRSGYTLFKPAL